LRAAGGGPAAVALALSALVLAGWGAWTVAARVPVVARSEAARVVRARRVHPVEAAVAGRVSRAALALGRTVEAGEVLVELDASEVELELAEARARLVAEEREAEELAHQAALLARGLAELRAAAAAVEEESRAALRRLELEVELAREEHARQAKLEELGGTSEIEVSRARTRLSVAEVALEGHRATASRSALEQKRAESDREAEAADLERRRRRALDQRAVEAAAALRLEHERELFRVRAPAAGEVGEALELAQGAWVEPGRRLGAVVSEGELSVLAEFAPSVALGRVRPGQEARLRFAGFPWSRFGTVPARVEEVAQEATDGRVRVELALLPAPDSAIPLQHGLVVEVEVDVERASPAELALRSVGR
jgi:membrane fusion protein (multidrug efflux system)